MIASYKYSFIFIRTKKTASTAVELGLSTICGPDDVITPIGPGQELMRAQMGASPQNFCKDPTIQRRLHKAIASGEKQSIRQVIGENRALGGCTGHMRAASVKAWVPPDFWDSAYKFTTERHPYEKALSLAHFRFKQKMAKKISFEDHLEKTVKEDYNVYGGIKTYTIDGKNVMDAVLLHDTLMDDIAKLRDRLGLPEFTLPRARGKRTDRRPAKEVLSDAQKEFIYERCKPEFELFGWQR